MVSLTSVHRLYQKLKISDEISRVRFSLSADRQSISMHHLDGDFKGKEEHYQRVE